MKIYQLNPTVVIGIKDEIYKVFQTECECELEFARLMIFSSPLIERDAPYGYEMTVVKGISIHRNILVMEAASGVSLSNVSSLIDATELVGAHLAKFHLKVFEVDGELSSRLFGDFSIDHIYIDIDLKKITTIDPGANFMIQGNQLEDVARFLFSVVEAYRYRPLTARKVLKAFINGYSSLKQIDSNDLAVTIAFRKRRSIEKYTMLKSPFRAFLGRLILYYNRAIIWWALKC